MLDNMVEVWDPSPEEVSLLRELVESAGWAVAHRLLVALLSQAASQTLSEDEPLKIYRAQGKVQALTAFQNGMMAATKEEKDE